MKKASVMCNLFVVNAITGFGVLANTSGGIQSGGFCGSGKIEGVGKTREKILVLLVPIEGRYLLFLDY